LLRQKRIVEKSNALASREEGSEGKTEAVLCGSDA
jgi:hypothetical protein